MATPTIEDTILLALKAHSGQKDLVDQPYVLHPLKLMFGVYTEAEKMAALLHDVVEDTEVTLDDIKDLGYSAEVVEAVDLLTHRPTDTYDQYLDKVCTNRIAINVKLADLEHNMDVRRLPSVTEKDAKRLNKYVKAYARLKAIK